MGTLGRALRVGPGEVGLTVVLGGIMLATSAGAGLGGTAADAILFSRFGVSALPQLYLALGIVSLLFSLGVSVVFGAVRRERVYPAALIALVALLLVTRALLAAGREAVYPVMWLATNVVGMLQGIVAWGVASWLCDARQAKRLFPIANAAKILGTIAGAAAVAPLVTFARTEDLLVVWALALVVALLLVLRVRRIAPATTMPAGRASVVEELLTGFRIVRASALLRWLAVALVLFSILFFALALPFTRAARAAMPREDDLAGFLGLFNATTTAAAFMLSLFAANRFYVRFGVVNAVLAFTLVYLAGFVALVVSGSFLVVAAARWLQLAWLAGMADAAYQALFNPVPPERRDQMRAFMEGVPGQAGIALAGLLLLAGDLALDSRAVAAGGVVAAAATAALIWRVRGAYRDALMAALRAGRPEPFLGAEATYTTFLADRATIDAVVAGARATDLPTRRASLQILADLAPASAREVLLAAAADADPMVRAHALRGGARVDAAAFVDAARPALAARDPALRAAALLVLLRAGAGGAAEALRSALAGDATERSALATALASASPSDGAAALEELCADTAPEVRTVAMRSLAYLAPERALAVAERQLAHPAEVVRALETLESVPSAMASAALRGFARERCAAALRDTMLAERVPADGDAAALLRTSLGLRARRAAREAVRASAVLSGRRAPAALLDALASPDARVRADAVEALETHVARDLAAALLPLWEPEARPADTALPPLASHEDPWIRECAAYLTQHGGGPVASLTTILLVERVLFLHKVSLFSGLDPADLQQLARIATERTFAAGDVLARQGETGDALYLIVGGSVRVEQDGRPIATRGTGEAVGEMSIVSAAPRAATLAAATESRVLRIGRADFESILRDRPETAMGVIRVLAARLIEATTQRDARSPVTG